MYGFNTCGLDALEISFVLGSQHIKNNLLYSTREANFKLKQSKRLLFN